MRRIEPKGHEKYEDDFDVFRKMGSSRFINPTNLSIKDEEGIALNDDAYAWLVKKYVGTHGMNITLKSLRDGIINEIYDYEY